MPAKKKTAAKKTAKKSTRKPSAAFMKPLNPDAALSEIVGSKPLPRTEVAKKLWVYIKKQVSMFEMTALVSKHLK